MASKARYEVVEVGVYTPSQKVVDVLGPGDVGYLTAAIKTIGDVRVGDTITKATNRAEAPLPGYRRLNPVVFCGLYPIDPDQYPDLKDALEKLNLNDASLLFEPETSPALGFGFRTDSLVYYIWILSKKEFHVSLILNLLQQLHLLSIMLLKPMVK